MEVIIQVYSPAALSPRKEPRYCWTGGRVDPRARLDVVTKKKSSSARIEPRSPSPQPSHCVGRAPHPPPPPPRRVRGLKSTEMFVPRALLERLVICVSARTVAGRIHFQCTQFTLNFVSFVKTINKRLVA
jgi:hypothetical protein